MRRATLLAAFALIAGCSDESQKTAAASKPILAVLNAQVKALNHRDADAALAIMHPSAPGLARTRETTEQVTQTYDLVYSLQNLSLESADENEAKVRFTQITQRVSGPAFRNNRVVGIHTLRKDRGTWKLYATQVISIDYLEK